ncbi:H-NS family nucleoid-associated regulatory protein [Leisingera daeponensis]|uniref:H-NS histone family protein n=1 Tax=Leisingera daeponensis TaxID=405746 RepID=UPI001C979E2A|nr:H-NS histone family protein [Leisingera daeponensis]MBY6059723.1 H-NS histone family protein [Leisingera daeponensis]
MDLKAMSSTELRQLETDVQAAIQVREKEDLKAAFRAAETAVAEFGFTLEEVWSKIGNRPKPKSPPKYRNPENPSQTWTGRGRKPQWIVEAIRNGRDISELEV